MLGLSPQTLTTCLRGVQQGRHEEAMMDMELATIQVESDDDIALTRNKAYRLGLAFGLSKLHSSQMASKVSAQCRQLDGAPLVVSLVSSMAAPAAIDWQQGGWQLGARLAQKPDAATIGQQQHELSQLSTPAILKNLQQNQAELARQQQKLKQKNRELEETTRLKSEFLANMSHELRTPMNAIIGFTGRVLKKGSELLPERQVKNLETVVRNAHHLLELINSLLDISKIEAGKMEVYAETFSVAGLLVEVMELTDALVTNKGLYIQHDIPDEDLVIHTDKTKLKQVMINLVSNAVKFTDDGGVVLKLCAVDGGVQIQVVDTGSGMEEKALAFIFDAFRQVDGSNTRSVGGTGLGLNISSRYCEMLGGKVSVESEVGVGSTFTIFMPFRYQEHVQEAAPEASSQAESAVVLPEVNTIRGEAVILCIDDNAEVLELLAEYLMDAGYKAVCVNNGAEGVRKARELQPLAITLDVQMPYKDGWSVLKELKADAVTRDIPVLMATMMDNKALGFEMGAFDYLEKPIMPENLIRSIEDVPVRVRHVMVVDDEESVRELMKQTLEDQGIIVTLAVDGVDALDILLDLGDALPDMMVLDLMMPRMNGFEVLDKLANHDVWATIPVVVSTAKTLSRDEQALLSAKANNIVQKGGDSLDKLVSSIRAVGGQDKAAHQQL